MTSVLAFFSDNLSLNHPEVYLLLLHYKNVQKEDGIGQLIKVQFLLPLDRLASKFTFSKTCSVDFPLHRPSLLICSSS